MNLNLFTKEEIRDEFEMKTSFRCYVNKIYKILVMQLSFVNFKQYKIRMKWLLTLLCLQSLLQNQLFISFLCYFVPYFFHLIVFKTMNHFRLRNVTITGWKHETFVGTYSIKGWKF